MGELMMKMNKTLTERVEVLASQYERVSRLRDRRLFTVFLVDGYKMTTLASVPSANQDEVVYAKVCLGMLITLYDDFADNPAHMNPKLLKQLYLLNVGEYPRTVMNLSAEEERIYQLAIFLFSELEKSIRCLTYYLPIIDILIFDIKQIFLANQYAELMTARPEIRNLRECEIHGPYNMGMVAAGMIDLMASPGFQMFELGKLRELLIQGQRLGRIGNVINTYEREQGEGDLTNEMMLHPAGFEVSQKELLQELSLGLLKMSALQSEVTSISMKKYAQSLSDLFQLHTLMKGII